MRNLQSDYHVEGNGQIGHRFLSHRGIRRSLPEAEKDFTKAIWSLNRQCLDVIGQFEETLHFKERSALQTIFVVRGLKTNLLGLPAIISLNLASRVDTTTVADYKSLVEESFPRYLRDLVI